MVSASSPTRPFEDGNYSHFSITISLNKTSLYYNLIKHYKEHIIKLVIYFFFTTLLLANPYPDFTKEDFIYIQKKAGKIAKNRTQDYQKTISSYKKLSKKRQLEKVNLYLNQLLPQYDDVMHKQRDYWATPKEFLIGGFGDCEDYVIIKYFTLLKLGFDKKRLYLTTVHEKYIGGYHMVLSYFDKEGESPLILDNLSFRILKLEIREDLEADIFINANGVYKIDKNNRLSKVKNYSAKFQELLERVKKNR
ncbi:transglutaminase-like cysteine peptidase [Sulfurimonas sp. CS5]|uniref:transglutaminase-like cysteine peptidase n=1 Tax=Sulfurimonas sp. CS5 TaxID=3391145 RepID=UPI0039E9C59B